MRIIAIGTPGDFWRRHPDAETPLHAWYAEASRAGRRGPSDAETSHRNVSFLPHNRAVFYIKSKDHRRVVAAHYNCAVMYARFIETHRD